MKNMEFHDQKPPKNGLASVVNQSNDFIQYICHLPIESVEIKNTLIQQHTSVVENILAYYGKVLKDLGEKCQELDLSIKYIDFDLHTTRQEKALLERKLKEMGEQ